MKTFKQIREAKKGNKNDWALQKDLMNKGLTKRKKAKKRKTLPSHLSGGDQDWALQKDLMNKGY